MSIIVNDGFDFCFDSDACGDCHGHCCRGESGKVWIDDLDVRKISNFLAINVIEFLHQFTSRDNNRLSLKERYEEGNYQCVFYDDQIQGCSVYEVRPVQCRRFPFWEYFKKHRSEVLEECPGTRCHRAECVTKGT